MYRKSAMELHRAFTSGQIKASEIAEYYLARIDHWNSEMGTFLHILSDRVLEKARHLDEKREKGLPLGRLAGVPIGIKDNMHIRGEITTCGSKFLENYRAPFDATVTRLLEDEDALLVGKTNLDEFAMGSSNENSAYFPAKNPWDLSCSPGGSSGGSAAAVGARLCSFATGSDTGGSIRQPASFCGVVGYKPTYGRVSRFGLVAFGSSLDQIGPFAQTVTDAAMIMEVMGVHCNKDSTSLNLPPESYVENLPTSLKEITIGVPWSFLDNLDESAKENFLQSVDTLKGLGAKIQEVDLDILKYSIEVYYILSTAEASTNLARFDGVRYGVRSPTAKNLDEVYYRSREEGFGPEVKKRILLGTFVLSSGYQDAFYRKAQKVRTLMIRAYEKAFETCDAIALPVCPGTAFKRNSIQDPIKMYQQDLFTISANLAGLPAVSLPAGMDERTNLPFGLQILGPQLHDVNVLRYAHAFESTQGETKIPTMFDQEVPK